MGCNMLGINDYKIVESASIRDAIKALNVQPNNVFTLFVVDSVGRLMGTVTDGDIRRCIVKGGSLDDSVTLAMCKNCYYLEQGNIDVKIVHELRSKGVALIPCLDLQRHIMEIYDLKTYKSVLPIDAVLMAGGKGERLRPLTEKTPKPLLPVGDKAIIDYNIDRLISYGIDHISVTTNYLHEQIEMHFEEDRNGVKVKCVCEPKYLGTIGSVKFVDVFCNDTVLVMNSDLFTNIDYVDFYLHFKENDADMSIAAVPYSISVPYGIFELDGRNIHGVKEKPTYNYYINAGIYLIKKHLLDLIPDDTFYNATDFMEMLIHEKKKVIRFPITGYWIDIGKPEDYKRAQELVKHL